MTSGEIINRSDPRHYSSQRLPPEVREIEGEVIPQLEVGQPGKVGLLELTLEPREGVTRVSQFFHKVPLQVLKLLYIDEVPDMAYVCIMMEGGGILQGDRHRVDITARAGSRAHITGQSATKIYHMEHNYASLILNLKVEADAYVEYLRDPVIPFRDARFYQETNLVVHRTGTLIYSEVILPGRVARGETNAYRLLYNRTEATDEQGRLLFIDTVRLQPQTAPLKILGLLGEFDVLGTMYVLTSLVDPATLAHQLYECLQGQEEIAAAASELPGDSGVIVRVLGRTSRTVCGALHRTWGRVRKEILGVNPLRSRKY